MRKIHGRAHSVKALVSVAFIALGVSSANAQNTFINQNISGFNLPGVTLPQGHDEVRAADGTTCRSAVSGNGAYLDVGLIGNPEQSNNDGSFAAYTRVVVPLGEKRERVNCGRLYDLEVRRLEIELKLMELGLNRGIAPVSEVAEVPIDTDPSKVASTQGAEAKDGGEVKVASADEEDGWANDGWTTEGLKEN